MATSTSCDFSSQTKNMGTILSNMPTAFYKSMKAQVKKEKKTQRHKPRGRGSERNKREEQENS